MAQKPNVSIKTKSIMIDLHSHILPGIDDGAKTLANSVEIVRELERQGITDVVATPHFMDETNYVSPRSENQRLLKRLEKKLKSEGVKVKIYLGNEIYINERIDELLKNKTIATLAGSKYILMELPMSGIFPNYLDIFLKLSSDGYQVVLAHPERYASLQKDFELIGELYEAGILLQCNLESILGRYGKKAQKTIKKMMKKKMVFAFGSDIHRCHDEDRLKLAQEKIKKYYSDEELAQVMIRNPRKIIRARVKRS